MAYKRNGTTVVSQHYFIRLVSGDNTLDIYEPSSIDIVCYKASVIRSIVQARMSPILAKKMLSENGLDSSMYRVIGFLNQYDYDASVVIVLVPETKCDTYEWIMGA